MLANPPFSSLPILLPQLASLVSKNLHTSALSLARIASPTTNPSYLHRYIAPLPVHISSLQQSIAAQKAALTKSRLAAATSALALLNQHTLAVAALIRVLEAKHGTLSRSLELRAAEIAQAAQTAEVDALAALGGARSTVYTPEVTLALQNYTAHLRDGKVRLGDAIRTATAELRAYGAVVQGVEQEDIEGDKEKERTMREMARVYREMGRQLSDVRGDLERLGNA